jgi:hypothetical protein
VEMRNDMLGHVLDWQRGRQTPYPVETAVSTSVPIPKFVGCAVPCTNFGIDKDTSKSTLAGAVLNPKFVSERSGTWRTSGSRH